MSNFLQDKMLSSFEQDQRDALFTTLKSSKQYNIRIKSVNKRELIDHKGHQLIDFASCNYTSFDLEQNVLLDEGIKAAMKFGLHTSRARLMGYHELFTETEKKLAKFIGGPEALIFPNTTLTSIGIIPALMKEGDLIILDKSAHATMYQAAQIARDKGAILKSYNQGDFVVLEEILKKSTQANRKMVCVDGVYSMTGDYADLPVLFQLAKKYNALIYIDDAHGFGFIGEKPNEDMPYGLNGNGIVNYHGLSYENCLYVAGTAKGLAAAGAFAITTPEMKEFLMAYAKPLDYTHPPKPFDLGILNAALDLQSKVGNIRRSQVYFLTKLLVTGLRNKGFYVMTKTYFPIISVWAGDTKKLIEASKLLYDSGIFLTSCPYPTMPKGQEALRITITSAHSKQHIQNLLDAFEKIKHLWLESKVAFFPKQ